MMCYVSTLVSPHGSHPYQEQMNTPYQSNQLTGSPAPVWSLVWREAVALRHMRFWVLVLAAK